MPGDNYGCLIHPDQSPLQPPSSTCIPELNQEPPSPYVYYPYPPPYGSPTPDMVALAAMVRPWSNFHLYPQDPESADPVWQLYIISFNEVLHCIDYYARKPVTCTRVVENQE